MDDKDANPERTVEERVARSTAAPHVSGQAPNLAAASYTREDVAHVLSSASTAITHMQTFGAAKVGSSAHERLSRDIDILMLLRKLYPEKLEASRARPLSEACITQYAALYPETTGVTRTVTNELDDDSLMRDDIRVTAGGETFVWKMPYGLADSGRFVLGTKGGPYMLLRGEKAIETYERARETELDRHDQRLSYLLLDIAKTLVTSNGAQTVAAFTQQDLLELVDPDEDTFNMRVLERPADKTRWDLTAHVERNKKVGDEREIAHLSGEDVAVIQMAEDIRAHEDQRVLKEAEEFDHPIKDYPTFADDDEVGTGPMPKMGEEVEGLPVAGYKRTQNQSTIDRVNRIKEAEERLLRVFDTIMDEMHPDDLDPVWMHQARVSVQAGCSFASRALFKPERISLPEDEKGVEPEPRQGMD